MAREQLRFTTETQGALSITVDTASYLTAMLDKLTRRQDALCARSATLELEQATQSKDLLFCRDRVSGLAETSTSMQASLTTNSKTLKGMDSFAGRICGSPRGRRNPDGSP